ncbi:MAG TPA: ECF-type sigma factor [Bryobacteraceae bacterium]|nr:ECF-type sigma factor [Bryobacteraceae bacterium]
MNPDKPEDITQMLAAWNRGDERALAEVIPLVYHDLRLLARKHIARSPVRSVYSGTLVHEAYIRLIQARGIRCESRAHFFALCSQMIRRILVDHCRRHGAAKRGAGLQISLEEAVLGSKARGVELEALDDALTALAKIDPRKARVVELRFFGGLGAAETAEVLEISEETVTRDWRVARTWLFRELARKKGD